MIGIAERITAARNKKKLTLEQLSEKTGIAPELLTDWENGASEPDTAGADKLAKVLGVSIDYIIFGLDREVKTMFPSTASPKSATLSDWRFLTGALMIFVGAGALLLFLALSISENNLVTVKNGVKYTGIEGYLIHHNATVPFYVFCTICALGVVICIASATWNYVQTIRNKNSGGKD